MANLLASTDVDCAPLWLKGVQPRAGTFMYQVLGEFGTWWVRDEDGEVMPGLLFHISLYSLCTLLWFRLVFA